MKVTATQTTICRQLVAETKVQFFNRSNTILEVFKCEESVNLAHYFPYDVKLRQLTHSQSFLANQKARNTIVGAENLLKSDRPLIIAPQPEQTLLQCKRLSNVYTQAQWHIRSEVIPLSVA